MPYCSHPCSPTRVVCVFGLKGVNPFSYFAQKTNKGELSVAVVDIQMLTKSLQTLPDKFHGVTDERLRFSKRYVDLLVTPKARATIATRARVIARLRRYLEGSGFLEMETPVLEAICGGADAKPFITYHNTLQRTFYLRIATELHLKRLLVGGFEKVFEIGRVFRNEGITARHNPEFTSLELYQVGTWEKGFLGVSWKLLFCCPLLSAISSG